MGFKFKVTFLILVLIMVSWWLHTWELDYIGFNPGSRFDGGMQRGELVQYYLLKDKRPSVYIDGYYVEIKDNFNIFDFVNPSAIYYGEKEGHLRSLRAKYFKDKGELTLNGDIQATYVPFYFECQNAYFSMPAQLFHCSDTSFVLTTDEKTKDQVHVHADKSTTYIAEKYSIHENHVNGKVVRRLPFEPDTDFSGDKLSLFELLSRVDLEGHVQVTHGEFKIDARKSQIFLENFNKTLKYFTFHDDVVVNQTFKDPKGHLVERFAYAEMVEGIRSEGKIILTGAPRVVQGQDIVKGNKITLRQGAGVIEVDDAISSLIYQK